MGSRAVRRVVAVAALATVTAGCGGADDRRGARGDEGTPVTSPAPTVSPQPSGPMTSDGPLVPREVTSILETLEPSGPSAPSTPRAPERLLGADYSWPQCPKGTGIPEKRGQGQPMPTDAAEFVIIGLTNSPSFTVNPCLEDHVDWARERGLLAAAYAVTTYPDRDTLQRMRHEGPFDGDTRLGALRNTGYQAALFNVGSMSEAGLPSPIVWVDVEPVTPFAWSEDPAANAAVVEGAVRGYHDSGLRTGFYSTPVLWQQVVGNARFGGPEWRAAGQTSMAEALRRCRTDSSFQGGPAVFGQWVEDNRDRNVSCPGAIRDVGRWFHQF